MVLRFVRSRLWFVVMLMIVWSGNSMEDCLGCLFLELWDDVVI